MFWLKGCPHCGVVLYKSLSIAGTTDRSVLSFNFCLTGLVTQCPSTSKRISSLSFPSPLQRIFPVGKPKKWYFWNKHTKIRGFRRAASHLKIKGEWGVIEALALGTKVHTPGQPINICDHLLGHMFCTVIAIAMTHIHWKWCFFWMFSCWILKVALPTRIAHLDLITW